MNALLQINQTNILFFNYRSQEVDTYFDKYQTTIQNKLIKETIVSKNLTTSQGRITQGTVYHGKLCMYFKLANFEWKE